MGIRNAGTTHRDPFPPFPTKNQTGVRACNPETPISLN